MFDITYQPPLVAARFLSRVNRFVAEIELNGVVEQAHLPTSGRLKELLVEGAEIWVKPNQTTGCKTRCGVELVRHSSGEMVSINSLLPNRLVEVWLRGNKLDRFSGFDSLKREPAWGEGRADLKLVTGDEVCLIEVKSVTLVNNGLAMFPDAPTQRGTRHLGELGLARRAGLRAAVMFVIQRSDALAFAPNQETDPDFATALRAARQAGVEISAITCRVSQAGITMGKQVEIVLPLG